MRLPVSCPRCVAALAPGRSVSCTADRNGMLNDKLPHTLTE
jgi:hypothetical protein